MSKCTCDHNGLLCQAHGSLTSRVAPVVVGVDPAREGGDEGAITMVDYTDPDAPVLIGATTFRDSLAEIQLHGGLDVDHPLPRMHVYRALLDCGYIVRDATTTTTDPLYLLTETGRKVLAARQHAQENVVEIDESAEPAGVDLNGDPCLHVNTEPNYADNTEMCILCGVVLSLSS